MSLSVPATDSLSLRLLPRGWVSGTSLIVETASDGIVLRSRSYSASDQNADGEIWSVPGAGDTIYVRLAAPLSAVAPSLQVLEIFVGLGNVPTILAPKSALIGKAASTKQPGQTVNYECRTSASNDPPSRSVAAIFVNNQTQCSGNLLNNSSNNGRRLFMTAKHCQTNGTTISNFIVYWNQTTPCGQSLGDVFDGTNTSNGATHVAEYQDGWLVQLTNPPAQSAQAYMAGFDASDAAITTLYGVHHAGHLDKQYYEATAPPKSTCHLTSPIDLFEDCWDTTQADGTGAPGASGSGGFDQSNRLVGVASMNSIDGSGNVNGLDYQRLAPLYDHGFASALDPSGGGVRLVAGMEYPGPFEQPPQVSISTSPSTVADGQNYMLTWSSVNAGACVASDQWGGNPTTSGSQQVTASNSGTTNIQVTYTLTCSNGAGQTSKSATETITPANQPGPTVSVSVSPTEIPRTSTATITWSSTNATSCTASGAWSGSKSTSGQATVGPFATAGNLSFILSCDGPGGNGSASTNLTVREVPTISNFTASPTTSQVGQTSTLSWSASNASSCTASGDWTGLQATSSTYTTPSYTTARTYTYRLTCSNPDGDTTPQSTATVTVQSAPAPAVSLTTDHSSIHQGESATLSWTSSDATSCSASGDWTGSKSLSGSSSVSPSTLGAHTYTLTCTNASGSAPSTTTIQVVAASAPTVSLTTNHSSIHQGESAVLSWTSTNATSCSAGGEWSGAKSLSGSETVSPSTVATHTYSLTCTGSGGSTTSTTTVAVTSTAAPNVLITPSPSSITSGQSATLNWTSSGANSCVASGEWSGQQPLSGSTQISPSTTGDHSYTLTCSNAGGSNSSTAAIHVNPVTGPPLPTVSLGANPTSINQGDSATLTWSSTNATSCAASGDWSGSKATSGQSSVSPTSAGDHVFSLTCTNASGSGSASATVHVNAVDDQTPTVTLMATPSVINAGQASSLSWTSTSAMSCQAFGDWSGAQATSGEISVSPTTSGDHIYSITCTNGAKSATGSSTVHVNSTSSGGGASSSGSSGGALGGAVLVPLVLVGAFRRRSSKRAHARHGIQEAI